jgi:hypothetical protein
MIVLHTAGKGRDRVTKPKSKGKGIMDSEFLCAARKGALLCKKIEEEYATKTILAVASGMPRR